MFNRSKRQILVGVVVLAVILSTAGCDNTEFKERIADFQQGVGLASSSIGIYFTEMNQFERELYLQDVYLHPTKTVGPKSRIDPKTQELKPGLFGPFNEDSIRARIDAVTLLGRYGQRLTELAGTDAPERFNSAAQALGTNLFNLQNTFQNLIGTGDPSARNYVGPIGQIVGAIGRIIIEKKRDQKLRIAIVEAAPAVRAVINQLEDDLNNVVVPQRLSGNSKALTDLIDYYNCDANPNWLLDSKGRRVCPNPPNVMTLEQRREMLNSISDAARRYELFKTTNPAEVIAKLRDAHEALIQYARNRSPKNLTALIASLDSFRSSAQQVADAVIQIRNLRRNTT